MTRRSYKNYYTWHTPLSDQIMGHNNGGVSCLIEWSGLDCDLTDPQEQSSAYKDIYQVLKELNATGCSAEWHLWREHDRSLADKYLHQNERIKRGGELAIPVRNAMARHLGDMGRSNQVALVLYQRPEKKFIHALLTKAQRSQQTTIAGRLLKTAQAISHILPGGRIAGVDQYLNRIAQSYWRKGYIQNMPLVVDYRYDIAEQVLPAAPRVVDGMVDIAGSFSKVLLLFNYPDAAPAWIGALADASCDLHIVQVVSPVDTRRYIDQQTKHSKDDVAGMADRGVKYAKKKISEREAFTSFVAENDLDVFKNVYLIHLHGDPDNINRLSEKIQRWASKQNGQVRDNPDLQAHFFRVGQPGHGCCSAFFREDHTRQIGNMAPVMVYDHGIEGAESLRISTAGQLVGFSILDHEVSHGFTVAKTGAGKGVDKVCEIIESYPFGLDWYIIEVGNTYEWMVEAFGKAYIKYNPDRDVINPLPDYDLIEPGAENPLPLKLCAGTISALAYLLTDGSTDLNIHQRAAAEEALQAIYQDPETGLTAPRLDHFHKALMDTPYDTEPKADAAKIMADNLGSFLQSSVGQRFTQDGNLTLTRGMCAVDLKGALQADPKLMIFCLTALSLRYSQMAFFSSDNPARVLLDEMHVFVDLAPATVGHLCSQISRMGRKEGASLDLVTQGLKEMQALDPEIIASATLRNLMYRKEDHTRMAEILGLRPGPLARWKNYPATDRLNWRPALRQVHDCYYDLYLTFPQIVLDIASTNPIDLALKKDIGAQTRDIFQRLEMLQRMRLQN